MSDEIRELLRRGAGLPRPSWGFDRVWRRSRRQRARNVALTAIATVGVVAVVAISVPLITSNEVADDRGSRIDTAGKGGWPPSATWERVPAAPIEGRYGNVAVWTGEEMIVWGGTADDEGDSAGLADGAAFNPSTQVWRRLGDAPLQSPDGRTAIWTGNEMLVWGGEVGDGSHGRPDNGAAYDPRTDTWTDLPVSPYWSLAGHSAIWTGEEMLVWGGAGVGMEGRGAAFDAERNAWRAIAAAPLDARHRHSAVWTGEEMLVWGGQGQAGPLATGGAYDPDSDSWRELPPAPISGRDLHATIWTGEEMIVWGGVTNDAVVSDGAAYNPLSNAWRELPRAPIGAALPTSAVWNGREMIVVGADGELAAYSPKENAWAKLSEPPTGAVVIPTLLRAEDELILWGGLRSADAFSNEGGILRVME